MNRLFEFLTPYDSVFIISFMVLVGLLLSSALTANLMYGKKKLYGLLLLIVAGIYFTFLLLPMRDYAFTHPTVTETQKYYTDKYENINCNCTIMVETKQNKYPFGFGDIGSNTEQTIFLIK